VLRAASPLQALDALEADSNDVDLMLIDAYARVGRLRGGCCSRLLRCHGLLHREAEDRPVLGRELPSFADELPIGELVFLPRLEEDGDAGHEGASASIVSELSSGKKQAMETNERMAE
jgi:hypothetical protein